MVEVRGALQADGSVNAVRIEVKEAAPKMDCNEFHGVIKSLPATTGFVGDWVVSSLTVHVSSITKIDTEDGMVAVGALIEIHGCERPDGSIDANEIEVERQSPDLACIEFDATIQTLPPTAIIGAYVLTRRT